EEIVGEDLRDGGFSVGEKGFWFEVMGVEVLNMLCGEKKGCVCVSEVGETNEGMSRGLWLEINRCL
ncbi:hypothetical protein, partial [Bacillus subtilis]|uniref:hypothetical protein n=1 Tax=Bacillus subtilis TaxID=1423 RepID=UPI001BDB9C75